MPLHRLLDPTYNGGTFPATHDKINDPAANGDPGVPALADSGKLATSGHANEGTYYIGFAEDGTSEAGNRPHDALAQNTDFLDDVCSGDLPVPAELEAVAGGAVSSLVITADVFVGMSGVYTDTQPFRDRLIKVIDNSTGNDMVDNSGVKVECDRIRNNADTLNAIGVPVSGFETNPTVGFTPAIPAGRSYRIVYSKRSSLANGIRNMVDLDLLSRLAVRAAHQTSAEAIRFITQASRRTGGNLTALAATLIETPRGVVAPGGSILPTANAFDIDIDPTDVGGGAGGGRFSVTFDRDGTPLTHFQVNEGTGGDSTWQNVFERIAFLDPNHTLAAFTPADIPLSEADQSARSLSIQGHDPVAQPVSILRRLNARQAIVCGGLYGDFTGASAIEDAIDFAVAAGHTYLHLQLTEDGAFTVSNKTVALDLVIEGVGPGSTPNYGSRINTDGAGTNGLTISAGFEFTVRNVAFRNAGGTATHAFTAAANASVLVENCLFENHVILNESKGTRSFAAIFRGCEFIGQAEVTGDHAIIELTTASEAETYLFENCKFTTAQRVAAMRLTPGSPGSLSLVRNIRFTRCSFDLHAPGVTASDPDYNSGPIFMENTGTTNLVFQDITFEDCNVVGNYLSTAGRHAMLLYFRAYRTVRNFNILGGRWELPAVSSLISPFYLGPPTANLVTSTSFLEAVRIENVEWGFTGTTSSVYGAAAAALSFSGSADQWAAFVIRAIKLTMKNVKWLTCTAESDVGDLLVPRVTDLNVDGLELHNWVDTAASSHPESRLSFLMENSNGNGIIRHLFMSPVGAFASQIVTEGIVSLLANDRLAGEDWHIRGFSHATSTGIFLPEDAGAGLGDPNGLSLTRVTIASLGGAAVRYTDTGVAVSDFGLLQLIGCEFFGCDVGLHVEDGGAGTRSIFQIIITGCGIRSCTQEGIILEPPSVSLQGVLTLTGNNINTNNGGIANVQMRLGSPSNQLGDTFTGIKYGNDFGGNPGSEGQVEFNVTGGADPVNMWGSETSLTGATKTWTSGNDFIHNRGRYLET